MASTRRLTQMEMTAAQRNDLAIGRVIAGLRSELAFLGGMAPFLEIFQQQRFLVSRPNDQDRFAALQCLPDPRKEGRILKGFAGSDGIGLVMQMLGCQIGTDRPFVGAFQPQIKDLGDAVIDPDDGVIVSSHDFSFV